jgi:hypothetical protein
VETVTATELTIGPYRVEAELGRGAFGVVYRAAHRDDPNTPVALKVIEAHGNLDGLMTEPALVAALDHPCVVRVLDYFVHEGTRLVIALEFVGGGDLKEAVESAERFSPTAVRDLLVQIGGALAEAHAKGVVHRDLKPGNILVDRSGGRTRYVLSDFGVGLKDEGIRSQKRVAGTYLFMAPEQLRGRAGPQSDLWALGVVAYRMLTGTYPFPGPTVADLARQIQLTTPPPPSAITGEPIEPDLERAVLKLLDRSETERIASSSDLLAALGHTGDARSVLTTAPATRPATRVGRRQESLDESLRRRIRRGYVWAVLWTALYMLTAPLFGLLTVGALLVFYHAHARQTRWRRAGLIVAALAVMGLAWTVGLRGDAVALQAVFAGLERVTRGINPALAVPAALVSMAFVTLSWLAAPIFACASYARANRLRRERLLLRAAGGDADEYLALLRRELEYRYEDVEFHLKYAEALAARGDDRGAAIEARLLLVQDPYHFTGNLLLAQSYARLGLADECEEVCDAYLAVAGYCFEFEELRRQCRADRGAA